MPVDRDGLHHLLWMRAHAKRHTLRVNQSELGRELGVSRFTMSRVMAEMVEEKRVVPLGKTYHNVMYRIVDPDTWLRQDEGDAVPATDGAHAPDP